MSGRSEALSKHESGSDNNKPLEDSHEGGNNRRKVEEDELVQFKCSSCHLNEVCHFLGKTLPSHKKRVTFKEDTFVMRDPFTPRVVAAHSANRSPWSGCNLLVIGGFCTICQSSVCVDCSMFYTRRYCLDCAANHIREFPADVGAKIQKKLDTRTTS